MEPKTTGREEGKMARVDAEVVAKAIDAALKGYRCQHTTDGDDNGIHLVDALTPPGDGDIKRGQDEMSILSDILFCHVIDAVSLLIESERKDAAEKLGLRILSLEMALALILPLAKGYAHAHPVGSNQRYVEEASRTLEEGHERESRQGGPNVE